jgi:chromosome segregation ATPase
MNEFQQQILQKIEQIALKLENYKNSNQQLTRMKEELEAKVNYLEKREQELKDQLEKQQIELSEKSELIDKATSKIEDLLGSIDIDA